MSVVMFYHLTGMPLLDTARALLGRAHQIGWRVMVRSPDWEQLQNLDRGLWLGAKDSFLPHGLEGGEYDADQPILLGQGAPVNGAKALMLVGGAALDLAQAAQMERVWVLFHGDDAAEMSAARQEWRAVVGAGLGAQYWSDKSGRWEKVTENQPKAAEA